MPTNLDINRLLRDLRITTASPGDKHYREGWVNIQCPFCKSDTNRFHLGYKVDAGYWNCYRCGGYKNEIAVVQNLSGLSWGETRDLLKRYGGKPHVRLAQEESSRPQRIDLPPGTADFTIKHKIYLRKRGFKPNHLAKEWGLQGTGPLGPYKFRIIVPIFFEDRVVSYLGRDITDRSPIKYKACPLEKEVIPHKHILYGLDKVPGHTVVIVEGVTDVWRLGPGAVATFGIEWTKEQANILKRFPRRFVVFDPHEKESEEQANKLAWRLAGYQGTTGIVEDLKTDPGAFTEQEAREFMRNLIGVL